MPPRRSIRRPEARAGVALAPRLVGPSIRSFLLWCARSRVALVGLQSSRVRHRIRRTPRIELIGGTRSCRYGRVRLPPDRDDVALERRRDVDKLRSEFVVAIRAQAEATGDPEETLISALADHLDAASPTFVVHDEPELRQHGDRVVRNGTLGLGDVVERLPVRIE